MDISIGMGVLYSRMYVVRFIECALYAETVHY